MASHPQPSQKGIRKTATALWLATWGKDIQQFIDFVPGQFAHTYYHSKAFVFCKKFLPWNDIIIRREYTSLLERMKHEYKLWKEKPPDERGRAPCFVITGQPGIGKTAFLIYILLYRLHLKLITAWQTTNGYLLFHRGGVSLFKPDTKDIPAGCWALTNSSETINSVCVDFTTAQETTVIQVTSPRLDRWKEFRKQQLAQVYIMDIWSNQELTAFFSLTKYDVNLGLRLAARYGASPRVILEILRRYQVSQGDGIAQEHLFRDQIDGAISKISDRLKGSLDDHKSLEMGQHMSSLVFYVRPAPDSRARTAMVSLPTLFIAHRFTLALIKAKTREQLYFFSMMVHHPWTRKGAGHVFETAAHAFLTHPSGPPMHAYDSTDTEYIIHPVLHMLPGTIKALHTTDLPLYWYPGRDNFDGVDSLTVDQDGRIFVFQFTISAKHGSPVSGLVKVRDALHPDVKKKKKHWHLVYVGLDMKDVVQVRDAGQQQLNAGAEDPEKKRPWLKKVKVLSAVISFGSGLSNRLQELIDHLKSDPDRQEDDNTCDPDGVELDEWSGL